MCLARLAIVTTLVLSASRVLLAASSVHIPYVSKPPRLSNFEDMRPHGVARELQRISGFTQQQPSDGKPATEPTDIYVGYDRVNLYVVWVCWDSPRMVRAHLTRREAVTPPDDDYVELTIDTFHDQRHGFLFDVNPLGMQADALWSEGSGPDYSFDTVWDSRGRLTAKGYIVWMAVPFRSLRFRGVRGELWGVTFMRYIAHNDEIDYWPYVSSRVSGTLNQEGTLNGFTDISPSHNMQFIPYVSFQNFRALDTRDPSQPRMDQINARGKAGLDSKFVFHDSLVLDATINPDFAQVESDEPQNTVNQRFRVFFPEKRPFFLENSNYFGDTNIGVYRLSQMLFTRQVADPSFGARLTGKQGPWNLGFFLADDRSPGLAVPDFSPFAGKRAYFAVASVSHDFGTQNNLGVIYTDREFAGFFNRVGGMYANYRINSNWTSWLRSVVSSTFSSPLEPGSTLLGAAPSQPAFSPAAYQFGSDTEAVLNNIGRRLSYELMFQDITPDFHTDVGFVPRSDIRNVSQYFHFYWRPEGKHLVFQGPEANTHNLWDHNGIAVQQIYNFDWVFDFKPNLILAPIIGYETDTLRPVDFAGLTGNHNYVQDAVGLVFKGSPLSKHLQYSVIRDGAVLIDVPSGQLPITGDETAITEKITLKPTRHLEIDNTYILDRVLNGAARRAAFNNHIL
ncbi:MAG: carbohydrate binding family 9 domain-containing protein, partial [Acidobacteria bacterium]|nr:carbohydrate binding family 9 domain-containing protein [Acidobacteriota bacterium]